VSHCGGAKRRCRNFDHDAIVEDDRLGGLVDQLRSHERHGLQQAGDETKDRARPGHIRRNDRRAREVHVIEPLAHRRAAALELGAKDVFGTAEDLINEAGKGGLPLVIEATNSPSDLGTLCASRIGG
jgi:hypothetical protein